MRKKNVLKTMMLVSVFALSVWTSACSKSQNNESDGDSYRIMTSKAENVKVSTGSGIGVTERSYTIEELQAKFPAGMYWNHEGQPNNTDPNSVTSSPCHNSSYDETCCNLYSYGAQCHGYALYLSYLYHGVPTETYGISHDINDLMVGDIVRYRLGSYDHTIFITGISGDNVKYTDCNMDLRCGIRWNVSTTKTELAKLIKADLHSVYDYPNQYSTTGFILSYAKRSITESYDIEDCCIEVSGVYLARGDQEPIITVSRNGEILKKGIDYTYILSKSAADYGEVHIFGEGKYSGTVVRKYDIVHGDLSKCTVKYTKEFEYTGEAIKPQIEVINEYGKTVDSKYYNVQYDPDSYNIGEHKIYISLRIIGGIYVGEKEVTYKVYGETEPVKPAEYITEKPVSTEADTVKKDEETFTEKETEEQKETSAETVTKKPAEIITEKLTEKPTEKPAEKATEKITEKPTEKATEKITEKPTEKVTESTTETIIEEPAPVINNIYRDTDSGYYGRKYIYSWDKFEGATEYVVMRAYCKKGVSEENLNWEEAARTSEDFYIESWNEIEMNLKYKVKVLAYRGNTLIGYTKTAESVKYELDITNIAVNTSQNVSTISWDSVVNVNGYGVNLYKDGELIDIYYSNINSYEFGKLPAGNYRVAVYCSYDNGSNADICRGHSTSYEFIIR